MAEDNGVVIVKSLLVFSNVKGLKGSYRMNLLFTLMSTWIIQHSLAQVRPGETIRWCTVNVEEQAKCSNLSQALNEDKLKNQLTQNYTLTCKLASNKEECMNLLDQDQADITSLDAGDVFIGGRYHSLIPIAQEIYANSETNYYAVAVIKNGTFQDADHIRRLRNKKACFAGVGSLAGWVIPIEMLMKEGGLEVIDCNNHVKSAINYFGPSCAVNSLIDKYNPVGDNPDKLCQLCIGRVPGERCTPADPYAGFEGAFRCLVEVGDVAFLKHTTVEEVTKSKQDFVSLKMENFLLLCPDGRKRAVTEYHHCHWGKVPGDTIVTTSAKSAHVKKSYQKFLGELVKLYGKNETDANTLIKSQTDRNFYSQFNQDNQRARGSIFDTTPAIHTFTNFKLFESAPVYGSKRDLLIQDTAIGLHPLPDSRQTFSGYLEDSLNSILRIRQCPVNKMTLCVTSDPEYEKCVKMMTALKAQLLKPEMSCYKARSHIHCMQAIRSGNADVAVFDAGDVYTAGLQYEEIPFISEVYNLGKPEYYVVAVAREEDPSTELTYLKGKYTCHTGLYTGAGWIIPMAYLLSNGWIRSYGCDSVKAASEYFAKSCVPGALNPEYASGAPYDNLCQLCHGTSYRYCRRDSSEDYYGYTGAFRCLVEGGGNVAFVKHTTVHENADGRRRQWWARNALNEDFQLLCPDGTRSTLADYKKCNLGKVKANAIVTRGGEGYNHTELLAYINLFVYAQQWYSRKDNDDFSMFKSPEPYGDLIFQDATVQLRVIEPEKRHFISYLGQDFMRARRIVDCHAGSDIKYLSFSLILAPFVLLFF